MKIYYTHYTEPSFFHLTVYLGDNAISICKELHCYFLQVVVFCHVDVPYFILFKFLGMGVLVGLETMQALYEDAAS